jgi:hypothetical protein
LSVKELIVSVVVKFQASLFLPFQPFTTAPDSYKSAFELFFPRGFFPSTIQEQVPGAPLTDRLALTNNSLGINVQFLSNRIDFLAMPFTAPHTGLNLARFAEEVGVISTMILAAKDVRVDRLALMSERMIDDLKSEDFDEVRKRFVHTGIDGFDEPTNIEWAVRQVIRTRLNEDYEPVCNQIYAVSRGTAQFGDNSGVRTFEALQVALDINTHPVPGLTFDNAAVSQFISHALASHDTLLGKIEKRIHDQ